MRIGLYNLEPQIVNSAMMRVSTYHKKRGDSVEKYNPIFHFIYDKVYAFSIFSFTPKTYVRDDMICGGTGFDLTTKLPKEIEDEDYDWSLYPDRDFSIIWFSNGCFRKCAFCVVPEKEGITKPVKPKNLNPLSSYIKVQDNNFFSNPKWREAIRQLKDWDLPVEFAGGIDARILTEEMCDAINSLKLKRGKQIKMAWDDPSDDLSEKFKWIFERIKSWKVMVYILIGFNSTPFDDLMRVKIIDSLGADPFVMPYNKSDPYQKAFARWCNRPQVRKSCTWEQYKYKVNA